MDRVKSTLSTLASRRRAGSEVAAATAHLPRPWLVSVAADYLTLTKPEITFLVTVSALAGFIVGSPFSIDGLRLVWALVGVALTSAGAGTLNHYMERARDASMRRTLSRPLPAGRVQPRSARNFGIGMTGAGLAILCPLVNALTAVLAALTVVTYLFVYTPLKQRTWLNTLVGTIPGALPALGGYTAATNSLLGWGGWLVFLLLVFWQIPHFLSLAWMYRVDYRRGGFSMLTTLDEHGHRTARQSLLCTVALIGVSAALAFHPVLGLLYAGAAVVAGALFAVPVVRFYGDRSNTRARAMLKGSILYIPVLVVAMVADWLL